tara:strand:- start:2182 stop:2370 length:189 start_codon:yes stop_codon:yes gene_type:complete
MKRLIALMIASTSLCSCSSTELTLSQQQRVAQIDRKMAELWVEYEYKTDSLMNERYAIIDGD